MPTAPNSLVSESGLGDKAGFLDVDPFTLQSRRY